MKIKTIITGSTGMVGEGVLHVCLNSPDVESILVINRKPCGVTHPKLKEIIHKDFMHLSPILDQLSGYNACYFCAGVSSVGKNEKEYTHITYDLTLSFANSLVQLNPEMIFCYVSGAGTDSSEKGRIMWARIKGKTENDLMQLPFKDVYAYRPGYIQPIKGLKNAYKIYKVFVPFYGIIEKLFPKYAGTLEEIGNSMINVTLNGYEKKVLDVKDIRKTGR
ncbi:MAG: epimerase [Ignavibacteriae bacterium]|nr:epimerase [Ignavibacteriota bacterium]